MRPFTRLRADAPANQFALRRPRYECDLSGPQGRRQRHGCGWGGTTVRGKEEGPKSQQIRRLSERSRC